MDRQALLDLCETYRAHLALGTNQTEGDGWWAISQPLAPDVHDAHLFHIDPDAKAPIVREAFESHFEKIDYTNVLTDPFTPARLIAHLTLDDFDPNPTLQLLLEGPLRGPQPAPLEIRPVESDDDWRELARLFRADHTEKNQKAGKEIYSELLSAQILTVQRLAAREVRFVLAWDGDEAVGFFSSWPGRNGTGMVEDLFTCPTHRRRGIARALIHHCVAQARAEGAGPILIGAFPRETPKHFYEAIGFRPACITTTWIRKKRRTSDRPRSNRVG